MQVQAHICRAHVGNSFCERICIICAWNKYRIQAVDIGQFFLSETLGATGTRTVNTELWLATLPVCKHDELNATDILQPID